MKQRVQKTYTFADQTINLHGYKATCTITDKSKGFHHSYLANLIAKKYNNNFSTFEATYVSKEGRGIIRAQEALDREDNKLAQVALKEKKESAVKKYKELKRFYRHIRNVRGETKYLDALPSRQTEYVKTVLAA
jgi:hypothetical protein